MQRRTVLKNLLLFAGGTMLLPSCLHEDKKVSIPLNHLKVSGDQESLLAEVCETIIPQTNTPGAKALGIHQFVLTMIDDCTAKEDQQKFMSGLDEINSLAKKSFSTAFINLNAQQKKGLLTRLEKKEWKGDAGSFYDQAKNLTVQGYLKSKYVMSNLLVYELVPGRFNGSFPINNKKGVQQHG